MGVQTTHEDKWLYDIVVITDSRFRPGVARVYERWNDYEYLLQYLNGGAKVIAGPESFRSFRTQVDRLPE